MRTEDRQALRRAAEDAALSVRDRSHSRGVREERWMLQTSNSFRRIGCHGDGDVLCGTKQRDGHPDLLSAPAVLDYIIAAQPSVVLALLDDLVIAENKLEAARALADRINDVEGRLAKMAKGFVELGDSIVDLTHAKNDREMREAANKVALLISQLTNGLQEVVS